jgi:hypothetical protein
MTMEDGPDEAMADAAVFERVAADVEGWERTVRENEPSLPDADVLNRALREALASLRLEVSRETFVYLAWRVERARAAAAATLAAATSAREAREAARAAARASAQLACGRFDPPAPPLPDGPPRTFHDAVGNAWSVHEVPAGPVPWARGPHCLVFGSEVAIRRVWHYPADWRELPDAELEALSWQA